MRRDYSGGNRIDRSGNRARSDAFAVVVPDLDERAHSGRNRVPGGVPGVDIPVWLAVVGGITPDVTVVASAANIFHGKRIGLGRLGMRMPFAEHLGAPGNERGRL